LHPFEYVKARSIDEVVALLSPPNEDVLPLAGGSDLLSEIKGGVLSPARLVDLTGIAELNGMVETDDGLTIGANTTIADIAVHPSIRSRYTTLAEAASGLATPQIRNVGTLGGNLNQRPRCWYYRHPLIQCLKKGGDRCYALAGSSKYLCITGGDRCYIVHPSDTAVALLALGATVEIAGPGGTRTLPIDEFFVPPSRDLIRENVLAHGEIVTRVHVPGPTETEVVRRSLYLKARERESGDFALVSVAALIGLEQGIIRHAAVTLGGVSPIPYRATQVEDYLRGKSTESVDPAYAGSLTLPDAHPMKDNGYKVPLSNNLVKRAITHLLGTF
jgi:xanthine dehydrogenase YagS FAD-binding subunit